MSTSDQIGEPTQPAGRPPLPSPEEFDEWLRAARRGSAADLGRVLDACRGYLLLLAEDGLGSTLRPKAGASDVVQDSLLDAQKGFGRFRGRSRDEFVAWVRQILHHNLADLARRYREAAARQIDRELPLDTTGSTGSGLIDTGTSPDRRAARAEEADALRYDEFARVLVAAGLKGHGFHDFKQSYATLNAEALGPDLLQ